MIEKTITIFRNKKPKKPKIWTFVVFLGFLKKPKNLGFLKATSTALGLGRTDSGHGQTDGQTEHLL